MAGTAENGGNTAAERNGDCYDLRLFVSGNEPRGLLAYANLRTICRENLQGRCRITVVDLTHEPEEARSRQITAVPTLMRAPFVKGRMKITGTLADRKKVLAALALPGGIFLAGGNGNCWSVTG